MGRNPNTVMTINLMAESRWNMRRLVEARVRRSRWMIWAVSKVWEINSGGQCRCTFTIHSRKFVNDVCDEFQYIKSTPTNILYHFIPFICNYIHKHWFCFRKHTWVRSNIHKQQSNDESLTVSCQASIRYFEDNTHGGIVYSVFPPRNCQWEQHCIGSVVLTVRTCNRKWFEKFMG